MIPVTREVAPAALKSYILFLAIVIVVDRKDTIPLTVAVPVDEFVKERE
ncbi:MAG: hypothetical protein IPP60_05625 [Sphingobacteriales bacterium]|nr:hypothetical protein [Sphingobacteriales bacterium]